MALVAAFFCLLLLTPYAPLSPDQWDLGWLLVVGVKVDAEARVRVPTPFSAGRPQESPVLVRVGFAGDDKHDEGKDYLEAHCDFGDRHCLGLEVSHSGSCECSLVADREGILDAIGGISRRDSCFVKWCGLSVSG